MSLRARLLIVIAILLFTYAVTSLLVIQNQRSLLLEQIDRRLSSVPPFRIDQGDTIDAPTSAGSPPMPPADSYSDIYIALVTPDGAVEPQVLGSLLSAAPVLDLPETVDEAGPHFETIAASDSSMSFRALLRPDPGGQGTIMTALPLQELDDAIGRLERTLALAGVLIAVVLAALYVWIQRLGIAPIARLAQTAEAITAGDHSLRAPDVDPHTEAGKLGIAFNLMLDERDETDARLKQFVADASHELRTPLTSMRGYLDLYRQGAFRETAQMDDMVRRLSSETNRMTDLVKDLLSLANLDEGRPLRNELVDLGRILRDAAQDAQAVQPGRPIASDTPETGPIVCADEGLIVQLVSILTSNALRHTPVDAAIVLRVAAEPRGAVITISDTGPGLDPESAAHAFDRFWRGESSRKRGAAGGSGLGLAIAKGIVDAHHGTISLDTSLGQGATFTIHLPDRYTDCDASDGSTTARTDENSITDG